MCIVWHTRAAGGRDAANGEVIRQEHGKARSGSLPRRAVPVVAAESPVHRAAGRPVMTAAASVFPSVITWAGAMCVVALMLPRILRWVPPILRELRYNRLTRTLAKTDLAEPVTLKAVVGLIRRHEECARDIERSRDVPPAAQPSEDAR